MSEANSNKKSANPWFEALDHVLLADESEEDIGVVEEILTDVGFLGHLHKFEDGDKAMAFLRHPNSPTQDLLLLDMKIAEGPGRKLLHANGDQQIGKIPLVILCNSSSGGSITASTREGPIHYLQKPHNLSEYQNVVKSLATFWEQEAVKPKR
jgi:DNA-binding NtrC family response regulator